MAPAAGPAARGALAPLEEAKPLSAEEEAVYCTMATVAPPGAFRQCDPELVAKALRGYRKEKPRAETTAAELQRIQAWRQANGLDTILCHTLPHDAAFHAAWPSVFGGEDNQGHVVVVDRIEDIDSAALSAAMSVKDMLDQRAQIFEALGLEKQLISRRRGSRVYKHISVIDLRNLRMSHFSKNVRDVIKNIIGLGSNYYPESLWKLYLINAPTIFRAVWAVVKPMIHPETLAKTFILGGQADYLPVFTANGLPLDAIPTLLGGTHPGISCTTLCHHAVTLGTAAAARYPGVHPGERLRLALLNLSPGVRTMAEAAAELQGLAAQGPAAEGSYTPLPAYPNPDMPGLSAAGAAALAAAQARRQSLEKRPPSPTKEAGRAASRAAAASAAAASAAQAAQARASAPPSPAVSRAPSALLPAQAAPPAASQPTALAPAPQPQRPAKKSGCFSCCGVDDEPPPRVRPPPPAPPPASKAVANGNGVYPPPAVVEEEEDFADCRDDFSVSGWDSEREE